MMTQSDVKKNVLTKVGYEKLVHELHELKTVALPEVVLQIKEAKAEWDLSENSEYHSAKEKQALIWKRILEIETMIKDVEILDEDMDSSKFVKYGSHVTIVMDNGKEYSFRMVWTAEVSISDTETAISFESPIGKAIEGKKEWDSVFVRLTEGRQSLTIKKIA